MYIRLAITGVSINCSNPGYLEFEVLEGVYATPTVHFDLFTWFPDCVACPFVVHSALPLDIYLYDTSYWTIPLQWIVEN